MTICSLVVHAQPENLEAVSAQLEKLEGVEIHGRSEQGKLIVIVDHPERSRCGETIMAMASMEGVLNASLVFEYHEAGGDPVIKTTHNNTTHNITCLKEAS